jgi:hypothetical protein
LEGTEALGVKSFVGNLVILLVLLVPASVSALTGVGVGTGKIILDESLTPDTAYNLPSITVYNTGDETSNYEMAVTFNERQPQLKPEAGWVSFSPQHFSLPPNGVQQVSMTIKLPANVKGGDYYAYLEAHAIASDNSATHILTAAAAKFYFTSKNGSAPTPVKANPIRVNSFLAQISPYLNQLPAKDRVGEYAFRN